MPFENETNHGRVEKMVETFGHIAKSALSNRADAAAQQAMMRPLIEAVTRAGVVGVPAETKTDRSTPAGGLTAGERAALHLADRASLRDLTAALLGRLEAHEARLADNDRAGDEGDR